MGSFTDARNVLDEEMTAGKQTGRGERDGLVFADDNLADLRNERFDPGFHAVLNVERLQSAVENRFLAIEGGCPAQIRMADLLRFRYIIAPVWPKH